MSAWQTPQRVSSYDEDIDPVKIDFVRDKHLRLDQSDEDEYLERLIRTSLDMAQNYTQRSILPFTYRLVGASFATRIALPYPPLVEVVDVTYYDADGVLQTVDPAEYYVARPYGPSAPSGYVESTSWPSASTRPDAVQITFRAGYVNTSVSPEVVEVPEAITSGRLLVIKDLYEQRGVSIVASGYVVSTSAITAERLWWPYRVLTSAG